MDTQSFALLISGNEINNSPSKDIIFTFCTFHDNYMNSNT